MHLAAPLGRAAAAAALLVAAVRAGSALAADDGQTLPVRTEAAPARPFVVKAMTTGGLRPGQVMQITPGHSEIVTVPAAGLPRLAGVPAAGPGTEICRQ